MRGQNGARIGADREESGMPEADLPGIADEKIEPDRDHRVEPDFDREIVPESVGEPQRQERHHQHQNEEAGMEKALPCAHTRSARRRPKSPLGLNSSTARIRMKATASL